MRILVLNRLYWLIPIAIIALIISISLQWNLKESQSHSNEIVLERARLVFDIIASFRYWSMNHTKISPNKVLPDHNQNNESQTPSSSIAPGKTTRQFGKILHERNDILIHLTSLAPVNPDNAALPWEEEALKRFNADSSLSEWGSYITEDNSRQFRYIAPLKIKKKCLSCHDNQGFKEGDIAGGISVNLLSGQLLVSELEEQHHLVAIHLASGLILSAIIVFGLSRHRTQLLNLQDLVEQQEQLVDTRTEQLQQEVYQREEAQERLSRFIESTAEGLLVIDHKGCCTLSNPSALNMLGYEDSTQLIGRPITEFLCPKDTPDTATGHKECCEECLIKQALKSHTSYFDDDHRFRRSDGSTFPVSLTASSINMDGHILGSVITFIDISERKRKEAALRTLSRAVEYSPAATIITDSCGKIEYVNKQFSNSSGYLPNEVIGKQPGIMQSGKTPVETYAELWKNITSGKMWHGELLNRKKDGKLFWEDISISPIKDEFGNISHFVAIKEDINERKVQDEETWRLANYDSLTGLLNRHHFLSRLDHFIIESKRYGFSFTLFFIDLDGFKKVNDSLGHDAGDALLKEAAARLLHCVRKSDTVARLGGDEFTLIIPLKHAASDIDKIANKLLVSLSQPIQVKGHSVSVSASIGIAAFPTHGMNSTDLLNHADTAMYSAKKSGKNCYCWYHD